ncbi:MAG: DUF4416 family protein [Candidatus Omnitrophica bacterium]|nr:DUF4416 family protein [Candidatus Omnitrophota bacterium]
MGESKRHPPVKLIIGMIFSQIQLFSKVKELLEEKFGAIDFESSIMDFNYTAYYETEMGNNLKRSFISFKGLIPPEDISSIKLFTNKLESDFAIDASRKINLDPGYLTLDKFVLATTKNYQHRIYLRDGIYAEMTLRYKKRSFEPWEWTYPDYRTEEYIKYFNEAREIYRQQSKSG